MKLIKSFAFASVSLLSLSAPAFAQDAEAEEEADAGDIVVTGTLIRGIAPGGSQSIGVSQEKITSIGAANTSDLISSIPQAGTFNGFVGVRGSSNFSLAVNRPILRYLGFQSSATASTLLLLDGHRMPGMGILQNTADLDAIAAGAIERVEVVTDGGSSTYGSDAVGGVINFITRKSFDGVEAKANYGFGEDYNQFNAAVTVGKAWEGGSAYVSYDFSRHEDLLGADRDWSQQLNWPLSTNGPVGASLNCAPGNIFFGNTGATFGLPGPTTNINRCDNTEFATIYPRETKHSALASLLIDPGGAWSFSVKAFYVNRETTSDGGPITADVTVAPASPFYVPVAGQSGNQTARISLGSVLGNSTPLLGTMESFGITPSVKVDVGGNWQVNAFGNYGRGKATFNGQSNPINVAALNAAALAGTFNPYNLGASTNAAAIALGTDLFQVGRAVNTMTNARIVADGPLFKLPGGEVRVALGAEYLHEGYSGFTSRNITRAGIIASTDTVLKRNVKSVFAEVNVPIIGEDNRGFFHSLTLTASARYDDYGSGTGDTFNPKFGVNFEPVDWLRLRGNWGKAFQAPGLADIAQATAQTVNVLPTTLRPFFDPATPVPTAGHNAFLVAFGGTKLPLVPQKAKTWSLGFDIKPVGSSFAAGLTYYNIDFKGLIGIAPINLPTFYTNFATNVVLYPSGDAAMLAYFNQLAANIPGGATGVAANNALAALGGSVLAPNFTNVYAVMDGRTANQSGVKTSGLDVYLRYTHDTNFGDIYTDIAGTYILTLAQGGTTGTLSTNGIDPNNRFKLNSTVGAHIGNFQAQVTWAHNSGFKVGPTAANLQQSYVSGFNVFNLFFQYKVPGDSAIAKDLAFTLNVDNVLNTDPPLLRGQSNSLIGAGNGFTLGRVVKFGVSKKF